MRTSRNLPCWLRSTSSTSPIASMICQADTATMLQTSNVKSDIHLHLHLSSQNLCRTASGTSSLGSPLRCYCHSAISLMCHRCLGRQSQHTTPLIVHLKSQCLSHSYSRQSSHTSPPHTQGCEHLPCTGHATKRKMHNLKHSSKSWQASPNQSSLTLALSMCALQPHIARSSMKVPLDCTAQGTKELPVPLLLRTSETASRPRQK